MTAPSAADLKAARCWFSVDSVPRDQATTDWKRRARLRQARWREAAGLPIGAEPYAGGTSATPVGSRIDLGHARATAANLMTPAARAAAADRVAHPEPFQTLRVDRLYADALSSMPLCFNLFGALDGPAQVAAAVRTWWPDAPAGAVTRRFEYSPGRTDPTFLGNKSAFDVAFEVEHGAECAIVGVETKYHEHAKAETPPREAAMARYREVTEHSGAFAGDWASRIVGTPLQQIWLDHLLVLSMLQHPSGRWTWGRFVLVCPAENPSFVAAAAAYRAVLTDSTTFEFRTLESLLDAPGALAAVDAAALRGRYLADGGRVS